MSCCFYLSIRCCFGYYHKILSQLLFWKFTSLTTSLCSSNLVLIVLTLYRIFGCENKSLNDHCNFATVEASQISFDKKTLVETLNRLNT